MYQSKQQEYVQQTFVVLIVWVSWHSDTILISIYALHRGLELDSEHENYYSYILGAQQSQTIHMKCCKDPPQVINAVGCLNPQTSSLHEYKNGC